MSIRKSAVAHCVSASQSFDIECSIKDFAAIQFRDRLNLVSFCDLKPHAASAARAADRQIHKEAKDAARVLKKLWGPGKAQTRWVCSKFTQAF
jgi:hypothetical protein